MEDLEELVGEFQAGAERRGLRFIEASFHAQPTVVFSYPSTSVEEALDIAQHIFAPFVSMTISRLDPSELIENWISEDEESDEPSAELLHKWEERAEQIDAVRFGYSHVHGPLLLFAAVHVYFGGLVASGGPRSGCRGDRQDVITGVQCHPLFPVGTNRHRSAETSAGECFAGVGVGRPATSGTTLGGLGVGVAFAESDAEGVGALPTDQFRQRLALR